jgi:iron complex transport system substrate-binding protein
LRIVSLLPSATEILYAIGAGADVVGVSHECDYPPNASTKLRIIEPLLDNNQLQSERVDEIVIEHLRHGESLYKVNVDQLRKAEPDLVITQELCDVCTVGAEDVLTAVNQLERPVQVLSVNPHSLQDVQEDIERVGKAVGRVEEAERVVSDLQRKIKEIRALTRTANKRRVFCVEWLKPLMNAGHWVPEMVEYAGGRDELAVRGKPSTYVHWNTVMKYDPELIVLMPCGFTTQRTLTEAKRLLDFSKLEDITAVHNGNVFATNGNDYFSRSGPRLFDGIRILAQMIHPELFHEPLDPKLGARVEIVTAKL